MSYWITAVQALVRLERAFAATRNELWTKAGAGASVPQNEDASMRKQLEQELVGSLNDGTPSRDPTTAIGVRQTSMEFTIYAPFDLEDLFEMIARPNKRQVTEEIYLRKVERWRTHWPELRIMSWNEA